MILQANPLELLSGNEKEILNLVITCINRFYVRHSQNDGYVIAVDLNDKKSGGFTWVLRSTFSLSL